LGAPKGRTCRDQHRRWWRREGVQKQLFSWGSEPRALHRWGGTETLEEGVGAETPMMNLCYPWTTPLCAQFSMYVSCIILVQTIFHLSLFLLYLLLFAFLCSSFARFRDIWKKSSGQIIWDFGFLGSMYVYLCVCNYVICMMI